MDKVVHFIMFAIEAWLIYRSIELKNHLNNKHLAAITIVFISLMGLTTEILQGLTYNTQKRMFSLLDLFFDILASVCVVLILNLVSRKQKQGRKN
ncbi:MAG: VanZ family protein [Bacteroidales bacterium]|nr:VanZ family protein [Bacteroidales bacterium]